MSDNSFDLIIVGGGPGGYVAAIRAAQLGMTVACVEKRGALGGTCLNVGCIPSKALLQSSHHFAAACHEFAQHGVVTEKVRLDLATMMARKDKVVADLTKGVEFLFKKNKVEYVIGTAAITGKDEVTVQRGDDTRVLKAASICIATGSDVAPLAGVDIDEKQIVSSTGALSLATVPNSMVVIGAGVIGLELGSVWSRLGAEVTAIEFLDTVLPGMDGEVCKTVQRVLKKQGMKFKLSSKVTAAEKSNGGVRLTYEPVNGGDAQTIEAEVVLVSIGRRPYTDGLGLAEVGVETDKWGFVKVDDDFQTSVPGIYAIGDVIGGAMLAHKAEEEGIALVENLAGEAGHVNYEAIPGVIYTWPEVAAVGKTEEQLKEAGIAYKSGKFAFTANSRARANADTDGFVKILADAESDQVLGVHIVGALAGDLIQEAVAVMEFGGSAEDIARSCHPHPGLGEAVKEAAMAVAGRAIHM